MALLLHCRPALAQWLDPADHVLLADKTLTIGKRASIAGGALAANGAMTFLGSSTTAPSSPAAAPEMRVHRGALLQGGVTCTDCRVDPRAVLRPPQLVSPVTAVTLPGVVTVPATGPKIKHVDSAQPLVLAPGAYRSLRAGAGTAVVLAGGSYQVGTLAIAGSTKHPTSLSCAPAGCSVTVSVALGMRGAVVVPSSSGPITLSYSGRRPVVLGGPAAKLAIELVAPYAGVTLRSRGRFYGRFIAGDLTLGADAVVVGTAAVRPALDTILADLNAVFPEIPSAPATLPTSALSEAALSTLAAELGPGMLVATFGSLDYSRVLTGEDASSLLAGLFSVLDRAGVDTARIREAAQQTAIYPASAFLECGEGKTFPPLAAQIAAPFFLVPIGPLDHVGKIHILVCPEDFASLARGEFLDGLGPGNDYTDTILHEMIHAMSIDDGCFTGSIEEEEDMAPVLSTRLVRKLALIDDCTSGRVVDVARADRANNHSIEIDNSMHASWRGCYEDFGFFPQPSGFIRDEVCTDSLDNDCDGQANDGCTTPPLTTIAIDFEHTPGLDGRIGTADDVTTPQCPLICGGQVSLGAFSTTGVTFTVMPLFYAPDFYAGFDAHYLSGGCRADFSVPVYEVALDSYSYWNIELNAYDEVGNLVATSTSSHPNLGGGFHFATVRVASATPIRSFSAYAVDPDGPGPIGPIANLDNLRFATSEP